MDVFIKMKQQYLTHMYQVRNDKFEWRNILNTINQYGCIFHIDCSENSAGTPKFEPQSAHFNKRQHSLHCTVLLEVDDNDNLQYKYIYHLSDDLTHGYAFTGYVVEDILTSIPALKRDKFIRFKSDNCSVQFKSKNVFNFWKNLSIMTKKTVILYYGVAGHGKGTVDAMSGFGVKDPIRKAIVQEDLFFNSAEAIYHYLLAKKRIT